MKNLFLIISVAFLFSCTATRPHSNIAKTTRVKIETDSGAMIVRLSNKTPLHKANFIELVKNHFYDGLLFHRVINHFMIQGGDPTSRNAQPGEILGDGGIKKTIPAEIDTSLFHRFGAVAAAREGNDVNPQKASSYSQFYIVEGRRYSDAELDQIEKQFNITIPESHRVVYRTEGGTPFLDGNYTVFGQVESGFDVLRKIAAAPRDANDRPLKDIRMKITLLK